MSQKKLQLHMAWKEKRRQQQLKAQYGIDRPDVVVVERKNVFVITLRVILHAAYIALRICASCAVAVLAIIGLASLIYPNIRAELVNSLGQVMDELQAFLAYRCDHWSHLYFINRKRKRGNGIMQKIITIANQKGGVGKTTTAMNLAAALVKKGKSTLLLDFDPQANLSKFLGYEEDDAPTISQLMEGAANMRPFDTVSAIRLHSEGMHYIPADIGLANADIYLVMTMCREQILRRILCTPVLAGFEYILIDCNPSLGLLLTNALVASTDVIIPVQAQMFSLNGMNALTKVIEMVRSTINPGLSINGILPTMVDKTNMSRAVVEALQVDYNEYLYKTTISRRVEAANATALSKSSVSIQGSQIGSEYLQLANEVIERGC